MKRIALLLIILVDFFAINNTTILTAAENPIAESVDFSNAVETVVEEIAAPKADIAEPVYIAPAMENYIEITGRKIRIENVDSTESDAGDHVNRLGNFLFGHNSPAVFGQINNLGIGDTFSVTMSSITTTYQIQKTVLYEKISGNLLHEVGTEGNLAMKYVAKAKTSAKSDPYDLSIMTCAGTSYGNGDASHRFVIFANAI